MLISFIEDILFNYIKPFLPLIYEVHIKDKNINLILVIRKVIQITKQRENLPLLLSN